MNIRKMLYSICMLSIGCINAKIINTDVPLTLDQVREQVQRTQREHFKGKARIGSSLAPSEIEVMNQRRAKAHTALQQLTGKTFAQEKTPTISLVCSGGGYAAMISTAGFLKGLEDTGVLAGASYLAGLSGSTWTMASWLTQDFSLEELRQFLRDQVALHIKDHTIDFASLAMSLAKKFYYGQSITLADLWGYLIGRVIFAKTDNGAFDVKLSQLMPKIKDGDTVFPIFTSVVGQSSPYEWVEFSPLEVGSDFLNAWITPEMFGKKFSKGETTDTSPEQAFSYLTGIFGSCYAVNVWDVITRLKEMIEKWAFSGSSKSFFSFDILHLLNFRLSPAKVHNFTNRLPATNFSGHSHLELVDAAIDFNLPFPPVLRRMSDIILVCDMSTDALEGGQSRALEHAQAYAKRKGLKFPLIDVEQAGKNAVDIFYDANDHECPMVLYFGNKIDFSMLKLEYTGEEFDAIYNYMYNAVTNAKDKIVDAVKTKVQYKVH